MYEQAKNKKTVTLYEFEGLKMNCCDWDKKLGLKFGSVRNRIKNLGWPLEKALSVGKRQWKK